MIATTSNWTATSRARTVAADRGGGITGMTTIFARSASDH